MPQSASTAKKTGKTGNTLKGRLQTGYTLLCNLLDKAGQKALSKRLLAMPDVDTVLKESPELVPTLLDLGWQLRSQGQVADLFQSAEDGATPGDVVQGRDDPIAPCGRSYDQVMKSLLGSAVRQHIDTAETKFAREEAAKAKKAYHAEKAEKRSSSLKARLSSALSKEKEPEFHPDSYRRRFPGHGLYEAVKPQLVSAKQFSLARSYVKLSTAQASALGPMIGQLSSVAQIDAVAALEPSDFAVLKGCARMFAEIRLGITPVNSKPGAATEEEIAREAAARRAVEQAEQTAFAELLLEHPDCLGPLLKLGPNADRIIQQVAPIYGPKVWLVLGSEEALSNVMNIPSHLVQPLGPLSRYVPKELSVEFANVTNTELMADILSLARTQFGDDVLAQYLADPKRMVIWRSLGPKFNNNFKYQRDAIKSGLVKNAEDLKVVCIGIFDSLQRGKAL